MLPGARPTPSSLTATPIRTRSSANRHVLAVNSAGRPHGSRWGPSSPQRTLASAIQDEMVPSASSSRSKRFLTGGREMNSSTSEALNLPEKRASNESRAAKTGDDSRSERSVMRYERRGVPSLEGAPPSSAEVPKPACTKGANWSIAGQSTTMSSSRKLGSSSSRCKMASRRTWTWRACPWHEWTWIERSAGSSS